MITLVDKTLTQNFCNFLLKSIKQLLKKFDNAIQKKEDNITYTTLIKRLIKQIDQSFTEYRKFINYQISDVELCKHLCFNYDEEQNYTINYDL